MNLLFSIFFCIIVCCSLLFNIKPACAQTLVKGDDNWLSWNQILHKYEKDEKVKQLIFVQHIKDTDARVILYAKTDEYPHIWTELLRCPAFTGYGGLGKEYEGDGKTPIGDYGVFTAAGIKNNPGAKMNYVLFDEHIFGADGPYYNTLVDDRLVDPDDLAQYDPDPFNDGSPQFNYGLFIDYNRECIEGKGQYIFMHCTGPYNYSSGCVAVSEADMKFIIQNVDENVRICIYPMDWY